MTTQMNSIDWATFKSRILSAQSILLISHVRPDGDAIGSQLALARALKLLGKEIVLVNADPVPRNLLFLDPEGWIRPLDRLDESEKKALLSTDLLISLDTSSWAQLGAMGDVIRASSARKLVLDHHRKGDDIGAERYVDPEAEATGSLVFTAIQELGLAIDPQMALLLFVAIATDTGWFRFHSVQASTYRMIAELIDAGVQPDEVYRLTYEQETFGRMKLIGCALSNAELFYEGRAIFTFLSLDNFDSSGAIPSESEDIINLTLQIAGTMAAIIMVEQRTGGYKLSFRSRCDLDCSRLAARFGGGGHKAAAGAFIDLPLAEAKERLLKTTTEMLNETIS